MDLRIVPPRRAASSTSTRRALGLKRPAARGRLDSLVGITLWLVVTHGFAGTGIGLVVGLTTL